MTALTRAAFLVALPLGAAWYLWHGHRFVAAALMAAAFAFIIGTKIRSDVRRKQEEENCRSRRRATAGTSPRTSRASANRKHRRPPSCQRNLSRIWKRCGRRLREGLNGSGAMRRYHLQAMTASCAA